MIVIIMGRLTICFLYFWMSAYLKLVVWDMKITTCYSKEIATNQPQGMTEADFFLSCTPWSCKRRGKEWSISWLLGASGVTQGG